MAKIFNNMNAEVCRKIIAISKSINKATTGVPTTIGTDMITDVERAEEEGASSVANPGDQTNVDVL